MKEIKISLGERKKLEDVRKSLVNLLDASLDILEKIANEYNSGNNLHKAIEDYNLIYKTSKNFISEEELGEIKERYEKIQEIWAPRNTKNGKRI